MLLWVGWRTFKRSEDTPLLSRGRASSHTETLFAECQTKCDGQGMPTVRALAKQPAAGVRTSLPCNRLPGVGHAGATRPLNMNWLPIQACLRVFINDCRTTAQQQPTTLSVARSRCHRKFAADFFL